MDQIEKMNAEIIIGFVLSLLTGILVALAVLSNEVQVIKAISTGVATTFALSAIGFFIAGAFRKTDPLSEKASTKKKKINVEGALEELQAFIKKPNEGE